VVSTKWDGSFHRRTTTVELGTDEHGTWLWMPPGTVVTTATGTMQVLPCLRLIPVGSRWSAYFVPAVAGRPRQVYVDITTPAVRSGDVIEFVDLDLDVQQMDDEPVEVLDGEEFQRNRQRMGYPPEVAAAAERTCADAVAAVRARVPPFDGSHERWLRAATDRNA
jgi:hypothetical protein